MSPYHNVYWICSTHLASSSYQRSIWIKHTGSFLSDNYRRIQESHVQNWTCYCQHNLYLGSYILVAIRPAFENVYVIQQIVPYDMIPSLIALTKNSGNKYRYHPARLFRSQLDKNSRRTLSGSCMMSPNTESKLTAIIWPDLTKTSPRYPSVHE